MVEGESRGEAREFAAHLRQELAERDLPQLVDCVAILERKLAEELEIRDQALANQADEIGALRSEKAVAHVDRREARGQLDALEEQLRCVEDGAEETVGKLRDELKTALARAADATNLVGELVAQRDLFLEAAGAVAKGEDLAEPTSLGEATELVRQLSVQLGETRDRAAASQELVLSQRARVHALTSRTNEALRAGRELAKAHYREPPETLQDLADLLRLLGNQAASSGARAVGVELSAPEEEDPQAVAQAKEPADTDPPAYLFMRDLAKGLRDERDRLKEAQDRLLLAEAEAVREKKRLRQKLETAQDERDRLKEDRDRLLLAEAEALRELDQLREKLETAQGKPYQVARETDQLRRHLKATRESLEAETAQRAVLKVERDHLARELAEATVDKGRASSEVQDLSAHLDAALAEMERLSQRYLESEAERFELWSEKMGWSTETTRLTGQLREREKELAEVRSAQKQAFSTLAVTDSEREDQAGQAEVAVHALTRVCLEDVDITRSALDRCNCQHCQEAIRRLNRTGYLPLSLGRPREDRNGEA